MGGEEGQLQDRINEYMHERVANRRGGIEEASKECMNKEVEVLLLCPSPWGTFWEGMRHQRL